MLQWASIKELAEANRLKRIEITKYCNVNRHVCFKHSKGLCQV
jgi:ribosomal protein L33